MMIWTPPLSMYSQATLNAIARRLNKCPGGDTIDQDTNRLGQCQKSAHQVRVAH